MRKKKTLGLFGGSFDPVHFGHIALALAFLEAKKVDRVLFCPAYTSPLKKGEPPTASSEQRLEMVRLAIAPIAGFALLDFEIKREELSYTIDTVRFLLESGDTVRLILGEDGLHTLEKWKDVEELIKLAPPLVGSRLGQPTPPSTFPQLSFMTIPNLEISSTDIRARLKRGLYCGHLVPESVLDYIQENSLYR